MATTTVNKKNTKAAKASSFGERTQTRVAEENQWQQYNATAKFLPGEMNKSLQALAEKTFPTDELNRRAYEEAIVKSLTETLSPEVGIKDFWEKMAEAGCKELNIEDGHLSFYNNKKERIDITPYTQPIVFEAHSSYYDQRVMERAQKIVEAKKQLEDLLEEINKNKK